MIRVQSLSKSFGQTQSLIDVSLQVSQGELFGLIGPDGAGKTTLMRILATVLLQDSGHAAVYGMDVVKDYRKIRGQIGYMPGRFSLYPDLSVEENLKFYAAVYKTTLKTNLHLIQDLYDQLHPFRTRPAGKLSGGMKQKLALCCALIHQPGLLILDEPTTGVDAVSRREFWKMLRTFSSNGMTIFVSTPYMDEAVICDRVALMQNGRILSINTPEVVVNQYSKHLLSVKSTSTLQLIDDLRMGYLNSTVYPSGDSIRLASTENLLIEDVKNFLKKAGHSSALILPVAPTIEDCFIDLMLTNG